MGRPRTEAPPSPYSHGQLPPETRPPPPTPETTSPYPPSPAALYSIHQQGSPVPVSAHALDPSGLPYQFEEPPLKPQQLQQQPAAPYPPPGNAIYPPPQPVAFPPLGQEQLNPLANAGPQPVNFPPEKYTAPPGFPQNASVAAAATGIPVRQQFTPTVQWTTGLFDCKEDPTNAVMTFFFPCVTFGQIAEIVDDGTSACSTSGILYGCVAFLIALPCLISCGYRTRLRSKFDLVEAPAPDWFTHFVCECCALCQEYRELRNRGLDPAIGWHANMARMQNMQQGVVMTPPVNQIMTG